MSRPNSYSADFRCASTVSAATSGWSREEALHHYAQTQKRWSQTHDQLQHAVIERATSPLNAMQLRRKDQDIEQLRSELANIQAQMEEYKKQLENAEATIAQQQQTIRTQSKAIENPRPGRDFGFNANQPALGYSPHRSIQASENHTRVHETQTLEYHTGQGPQGPQPRSIHGRLPPGSSVPTFSTVVRPTTNPFGTNSTGHTPQSTSRYGTTRVDEFGSPESYRPFPSTPNPSNLCNLPQQTFPYYPRPADNDPFAPSQANSAFANTTGVLQPFSPAMSYASPESFSSNPYPESSISAVMNAPAPSTTIDDSVFRTTFQTIFDMAQQYAFRFANFPSTAGDNALPKDTKTRLMSAATPPSAFPIMTDRETRYFLVSKIMIQWIIKHILKVNTFSGLDTQTDRIIDGTRASIYQDTPAQVRFVMLANMADGVQKIRARPDFGAYVSQLSQQRAKSLLLILRPMMHQPPTGELSGLEVLLQECYKLAEMMFSGTDQFSFIFPEFGRWYSPQDMINVDPRMGGYSMENLHACKANVRLSTTPVVRIRKDTNLKEGIPEILLKSKVILRTQ